VYVFVNVCDVGLWLLYKSVFFHGLSLYIINGLRSFSFLSSRFPSPYVLCLAICSFGSGEALNLSKVRHRLFFIYFIIGFCTLLCVLFFPFLLLSLPKPGQPPPSHCNVSRQKSELEGKSRKSDLSKTCLDLIYFVVVVMARLKTRCRVRLLICKMRSGHRKAAKRLKQHTCRRRHDDDDDSTDKQVNATHTPSPLSPSPQ